MATYGTKITFLNFTKIIFINFITTGKTLNPQAQHTWWHNSNWVKSINFKDTLPGQLHMPTTTVQQMNNTSYTLQSVSFHVPYRTWHTTVTFNILLFIQGVPGGM
jgi:hypothetical protein